MPVGVFRNIGAVSFTLLVFILPSFAASFREPIALAAKGQMQCYAPDTANKTCGAIASFNAGTNGKVTATAVILISPNPRIIMKGTASVITKSGELCGVLTAQNIEDASFSDGHDALDPGQESLLRTVIELPLRNVFGHEICGSYSVNGATLFAEATVDGAPVSAKGQRVIWIAPADGYKVGHRD